MNEKDKELAVNIAEAFFGNRLPIINGRPFASVHSNPTLNLADKIGAALTTVRQEVWGEVLKIANEHLDEPGFGYLLRDKLREAAANSTTSNDGPAK